IPLGTGERLAVTVYQLDTQGAAQVLPLWICYSEGDQELVLGLEAGRGLLGDDSAFGLTRGVSQQDQAKHHQGRRQHQADAGQRRTPKGSTVSGHVNLRLLAPSPLPRYAGCTLSRSELRTPSIKTSNGRKSFLQVDMSSRRLLPSH